MIISVAEDSKGRDAALPWVEAAKPAHPSLLDADHVIVELFGTRNVPSGIWIDETGQIVRPPEVAQALQRSAPGAEATPHAKYLNALRDWAAKGKESIYVLDSREVRRRTTPPTDDDAAATAYFRLGVHLYQQGHGQDAITHFKQAHALKPENWNLTRQAFNLGNPEQDYGTTLQQESQRIGPMRAPLDMPDLPDRGA